MSKSSSPNLTKPLASYSHARKVGGLVFIAGQGCRNPETNIWAGVTFDADGNPKSIDFESQVKGVLSNIDDVLHANQLSRHNLVDVQVFLTNMKEQFQIMNRVWNEFFSDVKTPPTRTTVAVSELPGLNLIEMKAIASSDNLS
jgi:2-aminomuconate deaminase